MVFDFNHLWWRIIYCRVSSQFTIQNMVYGPGLTGLTGWLKKQTITRFIPSFCSTLILTDKLQTPKTSDLISARKFYSESLDFPTNSNFGSWQSKLNKRYHFRPIIGLPICSTIMKAPFIIFGQFGTQVSHSLSNILSSSTICVDSSNCLLLGRVVCPPACVEDSFIPLPDIGVSNHVLETRLVWQTAICCYYSWAAATEIPLASYFSPKDLARGRLRDDKPNTEYQLFRQKMV